VAKRRIITGIDIGTYHVKVVIAEHIEGKRFPRVLGVGVCEARGLRHGYIIAIPEAVRSIRVALRKAEARAKVSVSEAHVGVGGISLEGVRVTARVVTSRADLHITEHDLEQLSRASEEAIPKAHSRNRRILHAIPLSYRIDGQEALGDPLGMKGSQCEATTLFITVREQHLEDIMQAVEDAGLAVKDVMATPLAASLVTLTSTQKIAGCVLVHVGSQTVSIAVFDNDLPLSLEVLPVGATDVTNDLALGFQISLTEAEDIKRGVQGTKKFTQHRIDDIIRKRVEDIFLLVSAHVRDLGKSEKLPAGVIITGGGSALSRIEEIARTTMKLPAQIAVPNIPRNTLGEIRGEAWVVAYGLCIFGNHADEDESLGVRLIHTTYRRFVDMIRQFLP
jgi:cell division protein FtsA